MKSRTAGKTPEARGPESGSAAFRLRPRPFGDVPRASEAPDPAEQLRRAELLGHSLDRIRPGAGRTRSAGPHPAIRPLLRRPQPASGGASATAPIQRLLSVKEKAPKKAMGATATLSIWEALQEEGYSQEDINGLQALDAHGELRHFATWKEAAAAGRELMVTDEGRRLLATRQLERAAPSDAEREDPTGSWKAYVGALLEDLPEPSPSTTPDVDVDMATTVSSEPQEADDLTTRATSMALLHRSHIASFLSLDPVLATGVTARQESPLDREDPGVYYRSQDKGHPQINLYKDWMSQLGEEQGHTKSRLLAPHNPKARALLDKATGPDTTAQKSMNVEQTDSGVTLRGAGRKHSEIHAGHIGLRKSNTTMLADMVETASSEDRLRELTASTLEKHGGTVPEEVSDVPEVSPEHLHAVHDELMRLNERLGILSQARGEPVTDFSPPTTESGTIERTALAEELDPVLSSSYTTRKLGQTSERADRMIEDLPELSFLKVGREQGNPQVTVQVPKLHEDVGNEYHEMFVNTLRTYFGARATHRAAEGGLPLSVSQRQSFGFLDTSVTDTGEAFRLSWGTEPPEMRHAVGGALGDLDRELSELVEGANDNKRSLLSLAGQATGGKKPLKTMTSPDARHIAYLKSLHHMATDDSFGLSQFLDYAKGKTNLDDPSGVTGGGGQKRKLGGKGKSGLQRDMASHENDRLGYISELAAAADESLSGSKGKNPITPPSSGNDADLFDTELPIVEPLSNTALMANNVLLQALEPEAFEPKAFPHLRMTALGDMFKTLGRANAALDELEALQGSKDLDPSELLAGRARGHVSLRNATEDLSEALLAFLSTTEIGTSTRAEDRVEDALSEALGIDQVSTFRTDSGEQAGTMVFAALAQELGEDFLLDVDDDHYFEFGHFFKENAIPTTASGKAKKDAKPTASFVDPRPYLTSIQEEPEETDEDDDADRPMDLGTTPQSSEQQPFGAMMLEPNETTPQNNEISLESDELIALSSEKGGGGGEVSARFALKVEEVLAKLKEESPEEDAPPYTLVADTTNVDYTHPEILAPLLAAKEHIDKGRLRIVLVNSGVKHEQLGQDKFQYGRISVLGKKLEGLEDFNDNPLLNQYLNVMEDLRDVDSVPTEELGGPDHVSDEWVTAFGKQAAQYDEFMKRMGLDQGWKDLRSTYEQAGKQLDESDTSETRAGHPGREAAQEGYAFLQKALDQVIDSYLKQQESGGQQSGPAYEAFESLPKADQEAVRARLLQRTESRAETSRSGAKSSSRPERPPSSRRAAVRPPAAKRTGIPNVGNSCYLSSGLNMLAFCAPYRELFDAQDEEELGHEDPHAELRGQVRGILDQIRAGDQPVRRADVEALRAALDERGLLPAPSAEDQALGITSQEAQQDPAEVFLRNLFEVFGNETDPLALPTTTVTDFTDVALTPAPGNPADYSPLDPENPVWRRQTADPLLDLSIAGSDTLQEALDAHFGEEELEDVRAVNEHGQVVRGNPTRWIEPGQDNQPRALTIALKRTEGLEKDDRDIETPEWLRIHGSWYRLKTVVHHTGASLGSGHYTTSTLDEQTGNWQYRDDIRVVENDPAFQQRKNRGYMYTFEQDEDGPEDENVAHARIGGPQQQDDAPNEDDL
jgi:Ubiquitin carboxyl-terminal hydrolase